MLNKLKSQDNSTDDEFLKIHGLHLFIPKISKFKLIFSNRIIASLWIDDIIIELIIK